MKRNCDTCNKEYIADMRNIKRGWGLCCSKSCAASKREKSNPNYSPERVERNNLRRETWNSPKHYGYGRDELGNYEGIGATHEFDDMYGHFSNEDN